MKGLNRALFLDLEGTIIKTKSGDSIPKNPEDWEFITGVLPSIKRFSEQGYVICIVSNQGGIELGKITDEAVEKRVKHVKTEIEHYIRTDINFIYCPSMDSYDRKPNPGMAYFLARELSLNLRLSIMVGDSESDRDFHINAGIGAYLDIKQFVTIEPMK